MKNMVPSKKRIEQVSSQVKILISELQESLETMENEKEDLFERFVAFKRLYGWLISTADFLHLFRLGMGIGHMLTHPILQTEEAKASGWGKIRLDSSPFFAHEGDEDDGSNDFQVSDLNLDKNLQ